jgi:hypothetical protein
MPTVNIYGPRNPDGISVELDRERYVKVDHPFYVDVDTLGDALLAYGDWYKDKVDYEWKKGKFTPSPGPSGADCWPEGEQPKYFIYKEGNGDISYVDVHVLRAGEEICPKQDVGFRLENGDIIRIGILVC